MFKFNICFENSSAPGYVTEKPLQSFFAGTIPIYWGHKETMQMLFNPDALIYVDSYEEAYNRVVELDNNPEMYKEMLLREPLRIDLDSTDSPFNLHGLHRFFDTVVTESFPEIYRRSSPWTHSCYRNGREGKVSNPPRQRIPLHSLPPDTSLKFPDCLFPTSSPNSCHSCRQLIRRFRRILKRMSTLVNLGSFHLNWVYKHA